MSTTARNEGAICTACQILVIDLESHKKFLCPSVPKRGPKLRDFSVNSVPQEPPKMDNSYINEFIKKNWYDAATTTTSTTTTSEIVAVAAPETTVPLMLSQPIVTTSNFDIFTTIEIKLHQQEHFKSNLESAVANVAIYGSNSITGEKLWNIDASSYQYKIKKCDCKENICASCPVKQQNLSLIHI